MIKGLQFPYGGDAPSLKERVEEVARRHDISTSSLVRMWIVERLRDLER